MSNVTSYEYDIFLSHNHVDQAWTAELAARLEQEEWQGRKLKVFFSPWDIRPGQSIPLEIERALSKSRKVGLVLSPEAMASAWVELERLVTIHISVTERQARLIPLYRRTCDIPTLLNHILPIDFRDDSKFEENYQKLLVVIKDEPLPRGSRSTVKESTHSAIPRPPIVGFVARRDKDGRDILERLKEELAPQKDQLVTLWGPGGVGKTTLAIEAARALTEDFKERIVWASAEKRTDFTFTSLLDEIAAQLGRVDLRPLAPEPKEEQVRALLAAAPALVVVDNFESITPGEQKRCTEWLADRVPCAALITTRQRVGVGINIPIAAMARDEAQEFLKRLIAQTANPDIFSDAIYERIIETAEANPLIMQWVVSQIDLAQSPDDVLSGLAKGKGDAAQRVFDRSFELAYITDDGRAALLALSLFVPSASRAALTEVAGFGNDIDRLNEAVKRLAALWLVKQVDGGNRLIIEGLTRQLTIACLLQEQRADEFHQRFVEHFLNFCEKHNQPIPEDYDALESERENALSAMDIAFGQKSWSNVMRIADTLIVPPAGMLYRRGFWDEAVRRGEQGLEAARNLQDEYEIARFDLNVAGMYKNRGELTEARRLYSDSLEIARKLGDQSGIALTTWGLGNIALVQGNLEEAKKQLQESLEIFKLLKDQANIARVFHQLGRVAQSQGDLGKAHKLYSDSLEIARKLGDQSGIATTLHNLAAIAQDQGDLNEARKLYDESLEIEKKLGNQSGIAITLHQLGRLAYIQGDLDKARRLYTESLEITKKLGDQINIALTLFNLGVLAEAEGDKEEAAQLYREALSIFEKLGSPYAEGARESLERVEGKS